MSAEVEVRTGSALAGAGVQISLEEAQARSAALVEKVTTWFDLEAEIVAELDFFNSSGAYRLLGFDAIKDWSDAHFKDISWDKSPASRERLALALESHDRLPMRVVADVVGISESSLRAARKRLTANVEAKKLALRAQRYQSGEMGVAERNRLEQVAALDEGRKAQGLPVYTQMHMSKDIFAEMWSQPTIQQDRALLAAYPGLVRPAFDAIEDDVVDAEVVEPESVVFDDVAEQLHAAVVAVGHLEYEVGTVAYAQQSRLWDDVHTYRADLAALTADRLVAVAEQIKHILTHLGVDVPATQQAGATVWVDDPRSETTMARLIWAHHTYDNLSIAELAERLGVEFDYVARMVNLIESDPPARRFPTTGAVPKDNLPINLPPEWGVRRDE